MDRIWLFLTAPLLVIWLSGCDAALSYGDYGSGKACFDAKRRPLPDKGYGSGGPVKDPTELSCDFKKPCCWKPGDTDPTLSLFVGDPSECVKNSEYGKAKYGLHAGKAEELTFESCSIQCADGPVRVKATYGRTSNVVVEICIKASPDGKPKGCKRANSSKEVTLPKGQYFSIVLRARGFRTGSDAIILKDINVNYEPCGGICCGMNQGLCGWKNKKKRKFKAYQKETTVGNVDTGVNAHYITTGKGAGYPLVSKGPFAAVALNPGETATISTGGLTIRENLVMTMEVYDACENAHIEVCVDGGYCKRLTKRTISEEDRMWQKVSVPVKKGTKKIDIKSKNTGDYFCAAGVTNIEFATKKGGKSIC